MVQIEHQEKISITALLKLLYKSKKSVVSIASGFVLLGFVYYFLSPDEYVSRAVILPETTSSNIGISGLASLAGINVGRLDNKSRSLNPSVYESIIRSNPFLDKILNQEYFFSKSNERITAVEFFKIRNELSPIEKIGYVMKMGWLRDSSDSISTVGNTFLGEEETRVSIFSNEIITVKEPGMVKRLRERLYYSIDIQTGLITVSLDFQDANAGAEILQNIIDELIHVTKEYQGQRDSVNIEQLDIQIAQKRREYEKALDNLAKYRDGNLNLIRASDKVIEQKLQNEVVFTESVFNSLIQQREQLSIQSQNMQEPVAIIEPVQVALRPYSPNLIKIMAVSLFLGLLFGTIYVLLRKSFITIIK